MHSSGPYLVFSPSSPLLPNACWYWVEFFCCTGRARYFVEAGRQTKLQHQPMRDLSPMCTRKNVAVELGLTRVGEGVVRRLVRIRRSFEVGSFLAMAGRLSGLLEARRALTMWKTVMRWEQAVAAGDHFAA